MTGINLLSGSHHWFGFLNLKLLRVRCLRYTDQRRPLAVINLQPPQIPSAHFVFEVPFKRGFLPILGHGVPSRFDSWGHSILDVFVKQPSLAFQRAESFALLPIWQKTHGFPCDLNFAERERCQVPLGKF